MADLSFTPHYPTLPYLKNRFSQPTLHISFPATKYSTRLKVWFVHIADRKIRQIIQFLSQLSAGGHNNVGGNLGRVSVLLRWPLLIRWWAFSTVVQPPFLKRRSCRFVFGPIFKEDCIEILRISPNRTRSLSRNSLDENTGHFGEIWTRSAPKVWTRRIRVLQVRRLSDFCLTWPCRCLFFNVAFIITRRNRFFESAEQSRLFKKSNSILKLQCVVNSVWSCVNIYTHKSTDNHSNTEKQSVLIMVLY